MGTRLDFWLDVVILVSYIFAYSYGFTGDAIHEWLGLALGLVMLVHLTLHWDWVVRTTRKLRSFRTMAAWSGAAALSSGCRRARILRPELCSATSPTCSAGFRQQRADGRSAADGAQRSA